ncbi:MAG: hypothetical protein H6853_09030 [Rhodospirillales bacterium]|nr:hypothetical protein [Alphaproteobacteria bacterium]USO03644.1 MAG: hypothetical protein H6853_09030 [Rhodospirillales bacterium]
MKTIRNIGFVFTGLSVLALSACGEGYEARSVRGKVPYVEDRTAGPGVEYVRAMMLPEKGPVLTPELPKELPKAEKAVVPKKEAEPIKDAAPFFEEEQMKGPK